MSENPERTFRTIRLPWRQDEVTAHTIGLGDIVQVISGARAGLRCDFRHPDEARFTEEFGIPLDVNGAATVAVTGELFISWPSSATEYDSREDLILRTFTAGANPAREAAQPLGPVNEETIILYKQLAIISAGATSTLSGATATATTSAGGAGWYEDNNYLSPVAGVVHRRRQSWIWAYLYLNSPTGFPSDYNLEIAMKGAPIGNELSLYFDQDHNVNVKNANNQSHLITFPEPLTSWRVRFTNSHANDISVAILMSRHSVR